ncbi:hypothetical protein BDV38DRAFT_264357 [Aspergillus pseudotamarii]|uniref:Uncharacterized protein n=1 Tax=Aspergillus pseudotamarii TaxID=132259 RepID=A0A5N6S9S8_ASPPS|nr:uncharacterized protein BDV38DRAFT_264357 [Aspergillus pseudotamarii]KAE8131432.1 hypothetical protein BDV38DRAFT_264357 [Aspergillus pseudotamarii]
MSSSPIVMIGMYVSYEVIAFSATLNFSPPKEGKKGRRRKRKKNQKYFMICSGFYDQCMPVLPYVRVVVVQMDADLPVGSCACSQKRQWSNVGCENETNTHWLMWNATNQFQC